jgi:DNA-binding NtrC family response regulator
MNPEIWTLVQDEKIEHLLRDLASTRDLEVRNFVSIADALGREEPDGGLILAIDAQGKFSNYLTIIKRFQKNFFCFETMVFGREQAEGVLENEREKGVDMYVRVPFSEEDFFVRAFHLVDIRKLKSSVRIVGRSRALSDMLETILQVAPTEVSVLIEGESGSGKELTAQAIHLMSKRRQRPFEAINCGALAEGILESELFGHERGSFTGAVAQRIGLFERADKGTLLLDEVGEMSLNMQVKLLRVIETGEFLRVGGNKKIRTDVRLIAATNRELETAVEKGEFRKDLYYRLKVVQVRIPPLRARAADIPLLVNYFIRESSMKHGKVIRGVDRAGMDLLVHYPWPGNVRELSNVIDNLTVLSRDSTIKGEDVEKRLQERMTSAEFPDLPVHVVKSREDVERELILSSLLSLHNDVREILSLLKGGVPQGDRRWGRFIEVKEADSLEPRDLDHLEREAIQQALAANGGNRRKTARQLGISERTLYRRLKSYGLG